MTALAEASASPSERQTSGPRGWAIVARKELADHLLSGRFIVLMAVLGVATGAAVFAASSGIREVAEAAQETPSLFLKLFTVQVDPVPFPLFLFVGFLGPLLGIMFGFDAVNGERAQGTLPRLLSQPIHRDEVILGKFLGGLAVIMIMLTALVLFVSGVGIFRLGVTPTAPEVWRLLVWLVFVVVYVGLWQALATLASVLAKRAATSAFIPVGVWLVLTLFGGTIIAAIAGLVAPNDGSPGAELANAQATQMISRASPIHLYQEGSSVLLDPSVRITGLVTLEQVDQALPSQLNLTQSLLVVWPQLALMLAMTVIMFAVAYIAFMRQEVRA